MINQKRFKYPKNKKKIKTLLSWSQNDKSFQKWCKKHNSTTDSLWVLPISVESLQLMLKMSISKFRIVENFCFLNSPPQMPLSLPKGWLMLQRHHYINLFPLDRSLSTMVECMTGPFFLDHMYIVYVCNIGDIS